MSRSRVLPMSWTSVLACIVLSSATAALAGVRTEIFRSTYRFGGEGSMATAFVVHMDAAGKDRFLVSAAHVIEPMQGEMANLVGRRAVNNKVERFDIPLRIREGDKPLWTKHPQHDVMVLPIPREAPLTDSVPLDRIASRDIWLQQAWEPGDLLWVMGCPHAAQFDPDPRGFVLTRLATLASIPELPSVETPLFSVEYNTFEGDSGGPVVAGENGNSKGGWIVGLVHGQHFLNEHSRQLYGESTTRMRMGLGIVVGSPLILETIELARSKR